MCVHNLFNDEHLMFCAIVNQVEFWMLVAVCPLSATGFNTSGFHQYIYIYYYFVIILY